MKQIDFYFDFGSPDSYLAFEKLPEALLGLCWSVRHHPVRSATTLAACAQRGPAATAAERGWARRHALWLAREHGVPLQWPAGDGFDPLPLLRLVLACDEPGRTPNRHVCGSVFRHVWRGGFDPLEPERLAGLRRELAPLRDPDEASVEAQLREHSAAARAHGLFGVPAFVVDGDRLFAGFDALPLLRACLEGDAWFDGPDWNTAQTDPSTKGP